MSSDLNYGVNMTACYSFSQLPVPISSLCREQMVENCSFLTWTEKTIGDPKISLAVAHLLGNVDVMRRIAYENRVQKGQCYIIQTLRKYAVQTRFRRRYFRSCEKTEAAKGIESEEQSDGAAVGGQKPGSSEVFPTVKVDFLGRKQNLRNPGGKGITQPSDASNGSYLQCSVSGYKRTSIS